MQPLKPPQIAAVDVVPAQADSMALTHLSAHTGVSPPPVAYAPPGYDAPQPTYYAPPASAYYAVPPGAYYAPVPPPPRYEAPGVSIGFSFR